jgi:hypothetical protein
VSPGDRVSFWSRGQKVSGTVVRVNRKTVTCELDDGQKTRVPKARLAEAPNPTDNVIQFPSHACGVGKRVWFLVGHRYPLSGTIDKIDRHGANVIPDEGSAEYYRVAHRAIHPTREQAMLSSRKAISDR